MTTTNKYCNLKNVFPAPLSIVQVVDTGLDETSCYFVDTDGEPVPHGYYYDELGYVPSSDETFIPPTTTGWPYSSTTWFPYYYYYYYPTTSAWPYSFTTTNYFNAHEGGDGSDGSGASHGVPSGRGMSYNAMLEDVCVCWGCTQFVHGRSRMTIRPSLPCSAGTEHVDVFANQGQAFCLHQARRSAVRCSASRLKAGPIPSKSKKEKEKKVNGTLVVGVFYSAVANQRQPQGT